jgi:transcription elongation GreA/GreB family factor
MRRFAPHGPAAALPGTRPKTEEDQLSRAFVKGDDSDLSGEELPERPISPYPNYVTPQGLAQLRTRYDTLVSRHAQLKAAGEDFDKPKLTEIERDLRYFSQRLESAILVDVDNEPQDEVHFGATVKTESGDGEVHEFTIVGEDEADVATGKVSWLSPLAKALIGAKEGDTVKWRRPAGDTELEIIEIHYPRARGDESSGAARLQS